MKQMRTAVIIAVLLLVLSAGAALFFVLSQPDGIQSSDEPATPAEESEGPPSWIVVPIIAAAVSFSLYSVFRVIRGTKIRNGLPAHGEVIKVWDTGSTLNDNPYVGMLLKVTPPGGVMFQAEGKTLVSRLDAALVQPGIRAEVKYDPNNLKKVEIVSLDLRGASTSAYPFPEELPAPEESAETRLLTLKSLQDKGLITAEEYQKKREEILRGL